MKLGSSIFVKEQNIVHELMVDSVIPWSNNMGCLYTVIPKEPNYMGSLFVHSDSQFYFTAQEAEDSRTGIDHIDLKEGDIIYHVDYMGGIHMLPIEKVTMADKFHRTYQCPVLGNDDSKQYFFDFNDDIFVDIEEAIKFQSKLQSMKSIYINRNNAYKLKPYMPVDYKHAGDFIEYASIKCQIQSVTEWPNGKGALYSCIINGANQFIHSDDRKLASSPKPVFKRFYVDQVMVYPTGFNPFYATETPMYVDGEYGFDEYRVMQVGRNSAGTLRYKCKLLRPVSDLRYFYSDDERLCYTAEEAKEWIDKDRAYNLARDRSLACYEKLDSPMSARGCYDGALRMV